MAKPKSLVKCKHDRKKTPSKLKDAKTKTMDRDEVLRAVKAQKSHEFYVWDGKSEDDKPLTEEEMSNGIKAYKESIKSSVLDAAADNPDLPVNFVKDLMLAKAEDKSLVTLFVPLTKLK